MFMGGFTDSILISQIDDFLARAMAYAKATIPYDFDFDWRIYGKDGTKAYGSFDVAPSWPTVPQEIAICCHIGADTQEEANHAAHTARIVCHHGPYQNQRATAGNLVMPFLGATSEFCIYHIMTVDDPVEYFPIETNIIEGENTAPAIPPAECGSNKK